MTSEPSNNITLFGRTYAVSSKALLLLAVVISAICLFPTLSNDWVNWDDDAYVLGNPMVQQLSAENISSMFTTAEQVGQYHPLTMLSLALDYSIWNNNAFGFHLTSLILHLINTSLVFLFIRKLSKQNVAAFIGALLFGMHPMHVESVAWISGRKDVLYTLFFLLSILSYLRYTTTESKRKAFYYSLAFVGFAISLLSKTLAFTLPLVLILLDYHQQRKLSIKAALDKIPFFALAVPAIIITKYSNQISNTMGSLDNFPLHKTMFLGTYNIIEYFGKAFLPLGLSPFHPLPDTIQLHWTHYLSAIVIIGGLFLLFRFYQKKQRNIVFGILFFLVSIAPISQIIPFGKAMSSERYTYVSYIGLFFILGIIVHYLLHQKAGKWIKYRNPIVAVFTFWLVFLGIQTNIQARVWENGETLWTQAIEKYPNHHLAYLSRGTYRIDQNYAPESAFADLNRCIELNPTIAEAYYERGRLQQKTGDLNAANSDYSKAIECDSTHAKSYVNRGVLLAQRNKLDAALTDFNKAAQIDSSYALAFLNIGLMHKLKNNPVQALSNFSKAIKLEPWNAYFWRHRGILHNSLGNFELAAADFSAAINLEPQSGESYFFRSKAQIGAGEIKAAIRDAEKAKNLGFDVPQDYFEKINALFSK